MCHLYYEIFVRSITRTYPFSSYTVLMFHSKILNFRSRQGFMEPDYWLTRQISCTCVIPCARCKFSKLQGPVVQSIVSLMSSLVVKMLTVLLSTISNSQVFLLENVSSFYKCNGYSHFSAKIFTNMPYLMIKVLTIR